MPHGPETTHGRRDAGRTAARAGFLRAAGYRFLLALAAVSAVFAVPAAASAHAVGLSGAVEEVTGSVCGNAPVRSVACADEDSRSGFGTDARAAGAEDGQPAPDEGSPAVVPESVPPPPSGAVDDVVKIVLDALKAVQGTVEDAPPPLPEPVGSTVDEAVGAVPAPVPPVAPVPDDVLPADLPPIGVPEPAGGFVDGAPRAVAGLLRGPRTPAAVSLPRRLLSGAAVGSVAPDRTGQTFFGGLPRAEEPVAAQAPTDLASGTVPRRPVLPNPSAPDGRDASSTLFLLAAGLLVLVTAGHLVHEDSKTRHRTAR